MWKPYIDLVLLSPESFVSDLLLILGIAAGTINYTYFNTPIKCLFFVLVACLCLEGVQIYYAAHHWNNHFLVNVLSLVEMIGFAAIYYLELTGSRNGWLIGATLGIYLLVFLDAFKWTGFAEYIMVGERLFFILYVVLHFQQLLFQMKVINLFEHSMFWVSVATLIYATSTMFVFLFIRVTLRLSPVNEDFRWYWGFIQGCTAIFYLILAFSFWIRRREAVLEGA